MIDPYLLQDAENPEKWWCFYKQNGVSMSYTYDMFHSPRNGIGILTSKDCVNWEDTGILLTLGQENWIWAQGRITAGFVMEMPCQEDEKVWLMFFHGSGPEDERVVFDQFASIGIAWSKDLTHWDWAGKK